ncbi:unnamed protein product [Bemisia tabaci]|uniref:ubiquitinyl hydrolase 1 n=1 Tax=Bemisia tabaci TaxID=7038 RepID=A0A9P0AFE6_BEMTA|nr:PREDICTED: ataxin-3-like [Bemisia tabaci]CAH0391644.1 unnamed protein product [Bemisia tabaci]
MESIFHEKQEGYLCAQHCLNALLQGPYFTPVELATLGQQMDDEERIRMAENGVDSADYQRFLEQPSGNMDDSGYFSVQVINSALGVWGLELVPYNSTEPRAMQAKHNPDSMNAYICNYKDHWFTVRKIGSQWFNLNSLLSGPELISNTYLAMFLAQLQQEGYSIFVVFGNLPESDADKILRANPVSRTTRKPVPVIQISDIEDEEDLDLKKALRLSLGEEVASTSNSKDCRGSSSSRLSRNVSDEDLETAIKLSLSQFEVSPSQQNLEEDIVDPDLQRALRMSVECTDEPLASTSADMSEVRRHRLNFLSNLEARSSSAKLNS